MVVFLFAFACYGTLACFVALNYRIVFDDRIPWDAYFSFDNRSIIYTGGGFERHPLSNYFFDVIREFALLISAGKKNDIFRLTLSLLSAFTISFSILQVFKYLKNIIKLPIFWTVIIIVFYAFFATNILLSFTPETYTFSLFLLVLFNHYSAKKIQNEKKLSAAALTFGTITIGGLTITNAVKVFIPVLFEEKLFKDWKRFFNATLRVLVSVLVFVLLYLYRLDFNVSRIFSKTGEQYEKFSKAKTTPVWDMISSWFFGGNVLFPGFAIRDYHNMKGFEFKALFMDTYDSIFSYLFVGILIVLVLASYIKNFKNKLVQILMISFFVDVIIHCILKFGLHTSYIYGGHFVFVYPLLFGWLVYGFRNNQISLKVLGGLLISLMCYLIFNNIYRMSEFFQFLNMYYK